VNAPALFNGQAAPDLAFHRGLHYGDGVFRTCLIYESQVVDITKQIDTVLFDAARLGLAPVLPQALQRDALQLARGQSRGVLKILLLRAGAARGYHGGGGTDRLLCRYPLPDYRGTAWDRGVRTFRSAFRLAAQSALAGIKHLNRLEQVLASRDWPDGADEALLGDDAGHPLCGTRTNLFWVRGGVLRTPSLDRSGVAGLMRGNVLALAGVLGIPARVDEGSWEELETADEVFLTNSLVGIWPVASVDSRQWRAPGPVTRQLADALGHPRAVSA
jgi:4-amino-4-deoxychorismate lyase